MRRLIIIVSALSVLGLSAVAYAASSQPYTGSITFNSKKSGTAAKPSPIGYTQDVKTTTPAGMRPQVQREITLKIYGLKVDGKDFPTCSLAKIATAHNDTVCPPKAMVASGYIRSLLGGNDFSQAGADCDPALHVWNSGQGKETYFFVTDPAHQCLGGALHTGSTPPYPGTYHMSGKYFIGDVKVPDYIDNPVQGLVGSLQQEHLNFSTQTAKVHGKTVVSSGSFACLKGKRPYAITTVTSGADAGSQRVTSTIKGSAPCS